MNSPMRLSSLKRRVNERVVSQETHETGVLMIFNHRLETVNGTVALVTEVVVLLLKMIGLVALLVVTKIGVLMIFNHRLETVNGGTDSAVLLQTITTNEQAVGQETTKIGVLMIFNHRLETVNGTVALVTEVVVLLLKMIGLLALLVVTKTGVLTTSSLLQETVNGGTDSAVSLPGPVMTIRTVLTVMISAIRTGTDVSVPQVHIVSRVPTVEMDKAVSGCAAKDVANLAHYLKWLWMK